MHQINYNNLKKNTTQAESRVDYQKETAVSVGWLDRSFYL